MGCSCREKTNTIFDSTAKINPYDFCLFCAVKHLSYSYAVINQFRMIGQIFCAYKHLENTIYGIQILKLLQSYFKGTFVKEKLEKVTRLIHQFAVDGKEFEESTINIEDYLTLNQINALQLLSVFQLYEKQIGYKNINVPYIIGVLQKVAETVDDNIKASIRIQWKLIEADKKLNYNTFKDFFRKLTITKK